MMTSPFQSKIQDTIYEETTKPHEPTAHHRKSQSITSSISYSAEEPSQDSIINYTIHTNNQVNQAVQYHQRSLMNANLSPLYSQPPVTNLPAGCTPENSPSMEIESSGRKDSISYTKHGRRSTVTESTIKSNPSSPMSQSVHSKQKKKRQPITDESEYSISQPSDFESSTHAGHPQKSSKSMPPLNSYRNDFIHLNARYSSYTSASNSSFLSQDSGTSMSSIYSISSNSSAYGVKNSVENTSSHCIQPDIYNYMYYPCPPLTSMSLYIDPETKCIETSI